MASVTCRGCGTANVEAARFCHHCGAAFRTVCVACGEPNPRENFWCSRCGARLPVPERPSAVLATPAPQLLYCRGCRAANEATARFCYRCGLSLADAVVGVAVLKEERAGFWVRLGAYLVDSLLLSIVTGVMVGVVAAAMTTEGESRGPGFAGVRTGLEVALPTVYYTYALGRWGQTLGKRIFGLKVLRPDGARLSYLRSFCRFWAYSLSALPLFLGFLVILFREDRRGFHDKVCDTVVIKTGA